MMSPTPCIPWGAGLVAMGGEGALVLPEKYRVKYQSLCPFELSIGDPDRT